MIPSSRFLPGRASSVGILVCYDIEFPEVPVAPHLYNGYTDRSHVHRACFRNDLSCLLPQPARALALKGADVLIVPTALARGRVSHLTPLCQVPCRAIENQVTVLYRSVRVRAAAAMRGTHTAVHRAAVTS